MKKLGILFCLVALTSLSACTKNKSDTQDPATGVQANKEHKAECEGGREPKIFEGSACPGAWTIQSDPKTSKKVCVFRYGPAISCPEGTKSTTYQAVCYGQVVSEGGNPSTPSDCESQFGKVPNPAPYRLACCPQ